MISDLLTIEELAAKLRVKKSWVYTHADELGVYRVGKYLRFSYERVLSCLDGTPSLVSKPNDPLQSILNKDPEKHREQIGNIFQRNFN
jgi:excisionase family DNA binding protein